MGAVKDPGALLKTAVALLTEARESVIALDEYEKYPTIDDVLVIAIDDFLAEVGNE